MGKMIFGLEQVLTYRKEMEKVRRMEFNVAQQDFDGACDRLSSEENRVDRLNTELLARQRAGITAMELQIYADFFRRKHVDIKMQRKETATLGDKMTEKREVLVEAAREKKILETLKDKKVQSHKQELLHKEQVFMEEIALRKKVQGK